jgi:hypothetical protein
MQQNNLVCATKYKLLRPTECTWNWRKTLEPFTYCRLIHGNGSVGATNEVIQVVCGPLETGS